MLSFVKKNKFFVLLCSTFVFIIIGLSCYFLLNREEPIVRKPEPEPVQNDPVEEKVSFSNFSGEYKHDTSPQVTLFWTLSKAESVTSVALYYMQGEEESYIADVTDTSSYSMPQSVYKFSTGKNTFKVKAVLENGESIESEASVNIPLILSAVQEIKVDKEKQSADITLIYEYSKENPVETPSIRVLDSDAFQNENISVKETTKEEKDGFMVGKTTYHFVWYTQQTPNPFTLRWYFNEIKRNYDFITDFSGAE